MTLEDNTVTRIIASSMVVGALFASTAMATTFSSFTPLDGSVAVGSLPEETPFQLSSPLFRQRTISANDAGAANGGIKLGDNWDMITLNETGPSAGRYLFSPYETGSAGVRRLDLLTGAAINLVAPGTSGFVAGDASRWTPWGAYLTGEESWGAGSTKGRLFEVTNPLGDPASAGFVQRSIIPRVSHEGLAFDKAKTLYFIDELNGGAIYRFKSANPDAANGDGYFAAGQISVLKVGAGGAPDQTGAATWVPITDASGAPLPGIPTADGSVDGRAAAALAAIGASKYNRPEDLEIQSRADGSQVLYFAATDPTGKVFSVDLTDPEHPVVKLFASQDTIKRGAGAAVGGEFRNPDNLAIDALGNIYVIEDQPGGSADIWFADDVDRDGVAESIARWASMSTAGAEPTGLYFDPFDPNRAFVNVQHAGSDIDRTIEFSVVPEPMLLGVAMLGVGLCAGTRRKRA